MKAILKSTIFDFGQKLGALFIWWQLTEKCFHKFKIYKSGDAIGYGIRIKHLQWLLPAL